MLEMADSPTGIFLGCHIRLKLGEAEAHTQVGDYQRQKKGL